MLIRKRTLHTATALWLVAVYLFTQSFHAIAAHPQLQSAFKQAEQAFTKLEAELKTQQNTVQQQKKQIEQITNQQSALQTQLQEQTADRVKEQESKLIQSQMQVQKMQQSLQQQQSKQSELESQNKRLNTMLEEQKQQFTKLNTTNELLNKQKTTLITEIATQQEQIDDLKDEVLQANERTAIVQLVLDEANQKLDAIQAH